MAGTARRQAERTARLERNPAPRRGARTRDQSIESVPPDPVPHGRVRVWRYPFDVLVLVVATALAAPLVVAVRSQDRITPEGASWVWTIDALVLAGYLILALSWVTADEKGLTVVTVGVRRRYRWHDISSVSIVFDTNSSADGWRVMRRGRRIHVHTAHRLVVPFAARRHVANPIPGFVTGGGRDDGLRSLVAAASARIESEMRPGA